MNTVITTPYRHTRQLIFDVETTGLFSKKKNPVISEEPHILQLAFVCYDLNENRIVKTYDSFVNLPKDVVISDFVTNLTGITHEICQEKGKPILEVLRAFYEAYMWCDGLIAHNMEFDEKMILLEIERSRSAITAQFPECFVVFSPMYEKMNNIERYCTMRKGTTMCNIEVVISESTAAPKKTTKKWPKLNELYTKMFPEENLPENLHNALTDVLTCLRCYLKMRHHISTESFPVVPPTTSAPDIL
jgi:DNA polymerase III epsilon subunit-like protein